VGLPLFLPSPWFPQRGQGTSSQKRGPKLPLESGPANPGSWEEKSGILSSQRQMHTHILFPRVHWGPSQHSIQRMWCRPDY
jgi:hypothetical protein